MEFVDPQVEMKTDIGQAWQIQLQDTFERGADGLENIQYNLSIVFKDKFNVFGIQEWIKV